MMRNLALYTGTLLAMMIVPIAIAHHSTAPYDLIHGTILKGEVTRFAWENPHAHIFVDVNVDGDRVERWTIEIDSPGVLRRLGWTRETLKTGDEIAVNGARAKDGSLNLKALTIHLPNGRELLAVPKIEN